MPDDAPTAPAPALVPPAPPSADTGLLDGLPDLLSDLLPHHAESVTNAACHLAADPAVVAVVLGGSLAHGYATPSSDIDITVVVPTEEYRRRAAEHALAWSDTALCTYPGGYVDAKLVDLDFLRAVAEHGSDAARWAYQDARVLWTRDPDVRDVLADVPVFPESERADRVLTFAAQLLAWRWYFSESVAKDSRYLEVLALQKLALFTCRLVLADNTMLYPFHKWLLRVTAEAPRRLPDLVERLDTLLAEPSQERVDALVEDVLAHHALDRREVDAVWPSLFLRDTELAWLHRAPVADEI